MPERKRNKRLVYRLAIDFASQEDLQAFALDAFGIPARKIDVLDRATKVIEYIAKR
jgi:hypothetical protein